MPRYLKKRVKQADKEPTTLLGAHVPDSVAAYIALFCEADGCSKTFIIEPLIRKWVKKAKKEFPEKKLIELTAERGWDAWKNRKRKNVVFTAYIAGLERELRRRLPEDTVEKIINLIKDAKNKEEQAKINKKLGRPSQG